MALLLVLTCLFLATPGLASNQNAALWSALRSGDHIALLRHSTAPGVGDPPEFTLGDCDTQRNLSDEGRAQATQIGARFRANDINTARVFSSQWCRSLDTATRLGLGPVQELPALNSFFQRNERREPQMRWLREWLAEQDLDQPLVLVTHQVNITALTGIYPSSGELVLLRRAENGDLEVIGTLDAQMLSD